MYKIKITHYLAYLMSSAKSPSPRTPKTAKRRKPDKITYHPSISIPGLPIREVDRLKIFKLIPNQSERISMVRKWKAHALREYKRTIPPDQIDTVMEKPRQITAKLKEQLQNFRDKNKADAIESDIKDAIERLDMFKRKQKFHDFQAKKENKFREQAELLKLWHSDNPPNAGESETSYLADSSDDDYNSSPPSSSFFGSFFGRKKSSPKYRPLRKPVPREKSPTSHAHVFEPANSERRWNEFRTNQIEYDKKNISDAEEDLKKLYEYRAKNKSRSSSQLGGRGRKSIRRRHGSSTRRRH
jgi:hypothetical protein